MTAAEVVVVVEQVDPLMLVASAVGVGLAAVVAWLWDRRGA